MTQNNERAAPWRTRVELAYKEVLCSSSCVSDDGVLLAVACRSVLTPWHTQELIVPTHDNQSEGSPAQLSGLTPSAPVPPRAEFLRVLVHLPAEYHLQFVKLVYKQAPLFFAVTATDISVWNALTLRNLVLMESRNEALDADSKRTVASLKNCSTDSSKRLLVR